MTKENQNDDWLKQSPYDRFMYFIAGKADRYKALTATIEKLGLNTTVISIEGNKHIFIFPQNQRSLRKGIFPFSGQSPIMLTAHYDRVEGSPGANDNSISVFHLLHTAMALAKRGADNWIIVFTDKEELKDGEGFEVQGSFTLAKKLKTWGLEKARIFNFDACGTGDTFIFSTTTDALLGNNISQNVIAVKNAIGQLRNYALDTANLLRLDKMLLAPTPFSDDIGFLYAGFAAQTITILPSTEAAQYEDLLRRNQEFTKLLISGAIKKSPERRFMPFTWQNLNTPADNIQRLTPEHFDLVTKFMVELCAKIT
ncbi:MAG: Zn-dependent exopeptidase M28 [Treponema sp.]|jgi:hypothetical protein|nr:Zn-dependent exopeptidase M28 [Treponema sp.]